MSHNRRYSALGNVFQPKTRLVTPRISTLRVTAPAHAFHTTPPARGAPLVPLLLAALKTSASFEFVRTLARVALTLAPVILVKTFKVRKHLHRAEVNGTPVSEEKKEELMHRLRKGRVLLYVLTSIPAFIFWATIVASLERTPLTGRWRLIILSPEEEDEIANQLAGPGWYDAIGGILAHEGNPPVISTYDWRYAWCRDTLRRLESIVPMLSHECDRDDWLYRNPEEAPLPPPADFPLRPRPRAAENLRRFCDMMCEKKVHPISHTIPGPPYSLVVVDKPEAANAFSYGFGPDGGGGIVVYSGFLDEVLAKTAACTEAAADTDSNKSWWSYLFGGVFASPPPAQTQRVPTAEQTNQLAILLAHELSHLLLSHHLESLSSGSVMLPGILSIFSDIVRVAIFPITMIFGPFVNDAVGQLSKLGTIEISKIGEYCNSVKQEIEADVVSARLLAHAGFDPREAVKFWEERQTSSTSSECSSIRGDMASQGQLQVKAETLARKLSGNDHPVNEVRVDKLKSELVRWETERRAQLHRLRNRPERSSIVLAAA